MLNRRLFSCGGKSIALMWNALISTVSMMVCGQALSFDYPSNFSVVKDGDSSVEINWSAHPGEVCLSGDPCDGKHICDGYTIDVRNVSTLSLNSYDMSCTASNYTMSLGDGTYEFSIYTRYQDGWRDLTDTEDPGWYFDSAISGSSPIETIIISTTDSQGNDEVLLDSTKKIDLSDFDLYYGDFNGDGLDGDIYFHRHDIFILIGIDINIPILLPRETSFVIYEYPSSSTGYSSATPLNLDADSLGSYTKLNKNNNYFYGDFNGDGQSDLLIRGKTAQRPAVVLQQATLGGPENKKINFDSNLSDPATQISIYDHNGDGYDDIVKLTSAGEADWVYFSSSNGPAFESDGGVVAAFYEKFPHIKAVTLVGASDGNFRVTEQGAANYSIPIELPTGTAGVEPSLSINYSSHGGNGLLGQGMSLAGLSSISYCAKTLMRDGKTSEMKFDGTDPLCLDGQRLLPDGNTGYLRTEIDSYIRVKDQGSYFTAEAKDGSIKFYGKTVEARHVVGGKVVTWALSDACDSLRNCVGYKYEHSNGSDFRVSKIEYAYGSGATADVEVSFNYEARPDVNKRYVAGELITTSKRLKELVIKNGVQSGGTELRRFSVHYEQISPDDGYKRSFVKYIQECVGSSNCLPATEFTWSHNFGSSFSQIATYNHTLPAKHNDSFVGDLLPIDINGDGYLDIAWVEADIVYGNSYTNGLLRYAMYNPVHNRFDNGTYADGASYRYTSGRRGGSVSSNRSKLILNPIDFNLDGHMDLAVYKNGFDLWEFYLSEPNASGGWELGQFITENNIGLSSLLLDADSDGLLDIVSLNQVRLLKANGGSDNQIPYGYDSSDYKNTTLTYTSRAFDPNTPSSLSSVTYKDLMNAGDLNGDGAADIILVDRKASGDPTVCPGGCTGPTTLRAVEKVEEHYYALVNDGLNSDGTAFVFKEYAYFGHIIRDTGDLSGYKSRDYDTAPITNLIPSDLNNDGFTDIVIRNGLSLNFRLNKGPVASGEKFTAAQTIITFDTTESAEDAYLNFVDVNSDGFVDLLASTDDAHGFFHHLWDNNLQQFESAAQRIPFVKTIKNYVNDNPTNFFVDINGDGHLDYLRNSLNVNLGLYLNNVTGLNDHITEIKNGLGAKTSISYESISQSDHYFSIEDKMATSTTTINGVPTNVIDKNSFYEAVSKPFGDINDYDDNLIASFNTPIMEYTSPVYVVTEVKGDSPSGNPAFGSAGNINQSNQSMIEYYYSCGRIQAGGVGFLGFNSVATRDVQTRVTTETEYRQDWPFVGLPQGTITRAPDDHTLFTEQFKFSDAVVQNTSKNDWKIYGFSSSWSSTLANGNGTAQLGPLKPYLWKIEENSFAFESDKQSPNGEDQIKPILSSSISSAACYWLLGKSYCINGGSTSTQSVLQQSTTTNEYDGEGNPTKITAVVTGQGLTKTSVTENSYDGSDITLQSVKNVSRAAVSRATLGRISRADVTETQNRNGSTETLHKSSAFDYFTSGAKAGLLERETFLPEDHDDFIDGKHNEYKVIKEYGYDEFGNQNYTATQAEKISFNVNGVKQAHGQELRSSRVEYDAAGRYVDRTFKDFGGSAGEKVITDVTSRSVNGSPLTVSHVNGVISSFEYDALGRQIRAYDNTGTDVSASTRYLNCSSNLACPAGTVFVIEKSGEDGSLSREYFDKLARKIRTATKSFNGDMALVDTEYDKLGRVIRISSPYKQGGAIYWTESKYDVLGRVITSRTPVDAPNAQDEVFADTIYDYSSYVTEMTNSLNQTTRETRNGLGELVEVEDDLGGKLVYSYNLRGDMTAVTKHAAANDPFFTEVFLGAGANIAALKQVVTTLEYDDLGRKIAMDDADKGYWQYKYNAFGELLWQRDANGNVVLQSYDKLGRLVNRTDYKNSSVEQYTRWFYDGTTDDPAVVKSNAIGQTSAIVMTSGVTTNKCASANGAMQCVYSDFDEFGRVSGSQTRLFVDGIDKGTYKSSVEFDSYGRVLREYDALDGLVKDSNNTPLTSGIENLYNVNGYLQQVKDLKSSQPVYTIQFKNIRGQVTRVDFGNGTSTEYTYHDKTGLLKTKNTSSSMPWDFQDLEYQWDKGGNLTWRESKGVVNGIQRNIEESYCYDNLNRLTRTYSATKSGSCDSTFTTGKQVSTNAYDSYGNIRYRYDGVSDNYSDSSGKKYYYGAGFSEGYANYGGPHAVTRVSQASAATKKYAYDQNGNLINDTTGRTLSYSSFDKPSVITKGDHTTRFEYGIDRGRYWRKDTTEGPGPVKNTEILYLGNVERVLQPDNTVLWKRYIAGVAIFEEETNNSNTLLNEVTEKTYIHKDHLGSTDVLTGADGLVRDDTVGGLNPAFMSFNPWGKRQDAIDGSQFTASELISMLDKVTGVYSIHNLVGNHKTNKGFTGHEMLDEVGLIHMNGRIYDPELQRFVQADPFIQASTNTQSYNRYSYTFNNPLNATDPSGFISSAFYEFKKAVGVIAAVVVVVGCTVGSAGSGAGGCTKAGWAFYSAIAAAGAAIIQGQDGKGVLIAAVSAAGMAYVGAAGGALGKARVAIAGVIGGISASLNGGKFGHGFISAGLSAGFGSAFAGAKGISGSLLRVSTAAVIGGSMTRLTGGKFKNGAATAAFSAIVGETSSYTAHDHGATCGEGFACSGSISAPAGSDWGMDKINEDWKDIITVTTSDDGKKVVISGTIKVSGLDAKNVAKHAGRKWTNVSRKKNGVKYVSKLKFKAVAEGGDWVIDAIPQQEIDSIKQAIIENKLNCDPSSKLTPNDFAIGGHNPRGKSLMRVGDDRNMETTAGHEFGHALGLNHAPKGSRSIMSYDHIDGHRTKVKWEDLRNVAEGYK